MRKTSAPPSKTEKALIESCLATLNLSQKTPFEPTEIIPASSYAIAKRFRSRGGFEVRSKEPALLENCSAIGCERGFWVADGTWLKNCSGDPRFGPLLYTEGEGVTVELTLLPDSSSSVVHSIAAIHGKNHTITIKTNQRRQRIPAQPILVGFSSPSAGENMSRNGENNAHNITLHNETTMPVVIGRKAQDCTIQSNGKILQNKGRDIKLL